MMNRDDYLIEMCYLTARRASCRHYRFGAVIAKDGIVLATGYNSAPFGTDDCKQLGCKMDEMGYEIGTRQETCRAVHAEQNAVANCARWGTCCNEAELYVNGEPCRICARIIVSVGISKVVYVPGVYNDQEGVELLKQAGIKVVEYRASR